MFNIDYFVSRGRLKLSILFCHIGIFSQRLEMRHFLVTLKRCIFGEKPEDKNCLKLHSYFFSVLVRPPELFGHPNPAAAYLPMHSHHPHHLNPMGNGKRKKSWTRAVFSHLQRKGLEKRFQIQKYITKPDRRQLAASLGLTDAQVSLRHALCKFLSLQRSQQQINEFYAEVKMSDFSRNAPSGVQINNYCMQHSIGDDVQL